MVEGGGREGELLLEIIAGNSFSIKMKDSVEYKVISPITEPNSNFSDYCFELSSRELAKRGIMPLRYSFLWKIKY